MNFDEAQLQRLFGHEAAENENLSRLKEYYFKSKTYSQVVTDLPLRIVVGHKGIGKSALFQIAIDEESLNNRLTILIKPDDIIDIAESNDDFLKLIREWKHGINEIISMKALSSFGLLFDGYRGMLNKYSGKALDFLSSTLKLNDKLNLNPSKKAFWMIFLISTKSQFTLMIWIEAGKEEKAMFKEFLLY